MLNDVQKAAQKEKKVTISKDEPQRFTFSIDTASLVAASEGTAKTTGTPKDSSHFMKISKVLKE